MTTRAVGATKHGKDQCNKWSAWLVGAGTPSSHWLWTFDDRERCVCDE